MKRKLLALILAMALGLTACGGGDAASQDDAAEEQPDAVQIEEPEVQTANYTVVESQPYSEGMALVVYRDEDGTTYTGAMDKEGKVRFCIQGEAVIFAFDQLSQADAVVANKARGIETGADLAGKTVAVSSGTSSEIILQFVLADAGLTMDDINTVEMNVEGMTTAILSDQIDAAATWSPNTITIQEGLGENYVVLGTNNDYTDQAAFPSSFITTTEYAEANHDVLVRFSQAILKAQVYRNEHIDEVAVMLAKELEAPEETMLSATGEGNWQDAVDTMGDYETIKAYYAAQQQVFLNNDAVTEEVPVENYVLFDVMEEAYNNYNG